MKTLGNTQGPRAEALEESILWAFLAFGLFLGTLCSGNSSILHRAVRNRPQWGMGNPQFYILSLLAEVFATLLCGATPVTLEQYPAPTVKVIPSTVVDGPIQVQIISTNEPLNFPKLSAVNNTISEFWAFSAVPPDLRSSVSISFYTATEESYQLLGNVSGVDNIHLCKRLRLLHHSCCHGSCCLWRI